MRAEEALDMLATTTHNDDSEHGLTLLNSKGSHPRGEDTD